MSPAAAKAVYTKAHQRAFTVAKACPATTLEAVRAALHTAMLAGDTPAEFRARLSRADIQVAV